MPNILQNILEDTRQAVELRKLSSLPSIHNVLRKQDLFHDAILRSSVPAVVAEIKMKSPSHGEFKSQLSVRERVTLYESAGATAISYVTNSTFFGGKPESIAEIKSHSSIPVLQKDFVIDEYQIREAESYGADALLLIARVLDEKQLRMFVVQCMELGVEPVVEIFDEVDLDKVLKTPARIVGVNARNLDTLVIDKEGACTIIKKVPEEYTVIGFSGVTSKADVDRYVDAGARGVLIGTGLMNASDINTFINTLR
jgi:indole-3-glycerol phosphate synthase